MKRIIAAAKRLKVEHWTYLIIVLVGMTLTLIWFRKGLLIATGESGDLLINPDRWLQSLRYLWQETYGTGISIPSYYPMIPFYVAISFLKNLKLSMVFIQGLVFGFLLISGGVFMCLLTNSLTSKNSQMPFAGLIAGLFYMLNSYTMTMVWNRFLYSQMFMYASLPLLLLLFVVGLEKQKTIYAGAAAIVSVAFSVAYMHPASIVVQWAVLLSYLLFYLLMNRRDKAKATHALKLSGTFALLWGLFNAWWILPFAKVAPGFFGSGYFSTVSENIGSLKAVSKYTNLYYISRLLDANPIFESRLWGDIYSSTPFEIISWLSPAIVLLGVVLGLRNRYVWYFTGLSVLALLFAKGATPPRSDFLPDLFKLLPISGVFRNPFEKTGIVIALGYAFLFGAGVTTLMFLFKKRLRVLGMAASAIILIAVLIVYTGPMWTGEVFGGGTTSVLVRVPAYYASADDWISQDKEDSRILHLPLAPSEGITYNWPYGYNGYELSHVLFKKPSISGTQWVPFANELYHQIARQLYTNPLWKMMALFNAKYVVLHNDIDYEASGRDSPDKIKRALKYIQKLDLANEVSLMRKESPEEPADWVLFWGDRMRTRLRWDSDDKVEGNASLELNGYPVGKHFGVIYHVPKDVQDWADKEFLNLWLKSNTPMRLFLGIGDGREGGMTWEGREEPEFSISSNEVGSWKRLVLPLDKPTKMSETPFEFQKNRVKLIFIGTDSLSSRKKVTLRIGGMSVIPDKLEPAEGIRYVKTLGKLDIFRVDERYFLKRIYVTNQFELTESSVSLFKELKEDSFIPGEKILVVKSQLAPADLSKFGKLRSANTYKPKIVFRKINPSQYNVEVRNAKKPFFLVFSETYNPDWKAYIDGKSVSSHFIANGYANAYYIDKKGSFQITLKYTPYALLVVGFWISVSALVISLLIVVWWQFSQKGNANENSNY